MNKNKTKNTFSINYLYYGILLASLVFFSAVNIFLSTKPPLTSKSLLFVYSAGYCFLEVTILIALNKLIQNHLPKTIFFLFLAMTGYLFLIHLVDFILIRIMDSSFYQLLSLILQETWDNFIEILQLAGIPLYMWTISAIFILLFSVVPFFLYKKSWAFCQRHPLKVKHGQVLILIVAIPIALVSLDRSASPLLSDRSQIGLFISMPWKRTLLPKKNDSLITSNHLKKPNPSYKQEAWLTADVHQQKKKPNIYLFIMESTRKDFITQKNTPNLFQFSKENTDHTPKKTIANANCTHIAWFSIFHSAYPFHWVETKKSSKGAPGLRVLRKMGYKIHAFSSSQLNYYGIRELLFGKEDDLLEEFIHFPHYSTPAYQSDRDVFSTLQKRADKHPEGQVFILFLDSTHFHYSFPTDEPKTLFSPYEGEPPFYVSALPSKPSIEKIRNRYKNSLKYVDSLFGNFRSFLQNNKKWDESLIVVAADHGEEFFENGHMFHASHLSSQQLEVPIIYKLPTMKKHKVRKNLSSHMDIFPTILHALGNKPSNLLEGDSLFSSSYAPFVLSSRYYGGVSPVEFSIQDERRKMIGKFLREDKIYSSKGIQILSIQNSDDSSEKATEKSSLDYFEKAFKELFPSVDDSR